jgi:hypothetical protein
MEWLRSWAPLSVFIASVGFAAMKLHHFRLARGILALAAVVFCLWVYLLCGTAPLRWPEPVSVCVAVVLSIAALVAGLYVVGEEQRKVYQAELDRLFRLNQPGTMAEKLPDMKAPRGWKPPNAPS